MSAHRSIQRRGCQRVALYDIPSWCVSRRKEDWKSEIIDVERGVKVDRTGLGRNHYTREQLEKPQTKGHRVAIQMGKTAAEASEKPSMNQDYVDQWN